jgi:hypothetical protein
MGMLSGILSTGRWESNPRPKLGKLILKRENARFGGILAFCSCPPNGFQLEQRLWGPWRAETASKSSTFIGFNRRLGEQYNRAAKKVSRAIRGGLHKVVDHLTTGIQD